MSSEVQRLVLEALARDFAVDVSPAAELQGPALDAWIQQAEDFVFDREYAAFRAQRAEMDLPVGGAR